MDKLPIGAIIGIVVGLVAVVAVAILLCWCCCTGYIYKFMEAAGFARTTVPDSSAGAVYKEGSVDSNLEKVSTTSSTVQLRNGINYQVTGQTSFPRLLISFWSLFGGNKVFVSTILITPAVEYKLY